MVLTSWRSQFLNKSNKNTLWKEPPHKRQTHLICLPYSPLIPFTKNIAAPPLCISSCLFLWQVESHLLCFGLVNGEAKVEFRLQSLKSHQVKQGKRCAGLSVCLSTGPVVSTLCWSCLRTGFLWHELLARVSDWSVAEFVKVSQQSMDLGLVAQVQNLMSNADRSFTLPLGPCLCIRDALLWCCCKQLKGYLTTQGL